MLGRDDLSQQCEWRALTPPIAQARGLPSHDPEALDDEKAPEPADSPPSLEATTAVMSDPVPETPLPTVCANRLLATLHTEDRDRLAAKMHPVQFSRAQTLYETDAVTPYTYFPTSGLTSILAVTRRGDAVGIAAVGNEGAIGWPLSFLGSTHRVVVEVSGRAYRIRSDVLRAAFGKTDGLQNVLLAHIQHVMAQISQSVVCHRFHTVPERLARWLLAVCDHTQSNRLRLTQAGIARVLGIQRTGVTAAASELKNAGVIWYQHGRLVIVNRQRLEREACECYRASALFQGTLPHA